MSQIPPSERVQIQKWLRPSRAPWFSVAISLPLLPSIAALTDGINNDREALRSGAALLKTAAATAAPLQPTPLVLNSAAEKAREQPWIVEVNDLLFLSASSLVLTAMIAAAFWLTAVERFGDPDRAVGLTARRLLKIELSGNKRSGLFWRRQVERELIQLRKRARRAGITSSKIEVVQRNAATDFQSGRTKSMQFSIRKLLRDHASGLLLEDLSTVNPSKSKRISDQWRQKRLPGRFTRAAEISTIVSAAVVLFTLVRN